MKKIIWIQILLGMTSVAYADSTIEVKVDKAELVDKETRERPIVVLSYRGHDVGAINCAGNYRFLVPNVASQYILQFSACTSMALLLLDSAAENTPVTILFGTYATPPDGNPVTKGYVKAISFSEPK